MVRFKHFLILLPVFIVVACNESIPASKTPAKKKNRGSDFVFRERIVKGNDTAMLQVPGRVESVLAQHWFLDNTNDVSDDKLIWENGDGERLFPSFSLFADSTVVENPRGELKIGTWRRELKDKINSIVITYGNNDKRIFRIRELSLTRLKVSWRDGEDSFWIRFRADGLSHQDEHNDPYHPINNSWRLKPLKKEIPAAIHKRVKDCVKFYALYYRDQIKRRKKVIEFLGLPEIFRWYNGGIGLPMKADMSESWIDCFYNREQAEKGYDILNDLIVRNEFDWPTNTPGWHYRTHSVLEQMYEKLDHP